MRGVGRVLAGLAVTCVAVAAGLFSGFWAAIGACDGAQEDSDAWICSGGWGALLGPLEVLLVFGALLAPIIGGLGTVFDGRWRWTWIGVAVAAACALLQFLLGFGQESTLS